MGEFWWRYQQVVGKGDGEQLEIAFLEMLVSDVAVDLNVFGDQAI